jgi:hypothetical protein
VITAGLSSNGNTHVGGATVDIESFSGTKVWGTLEVEQQCKVLGWLRTDYLATTTGSGNVNVQNNMIMNGNILYGGNGTLQGFTEVKGDRVYATSAGTTTSAANVRNGAGGQLLTVTSSARKYKENFQNYVADPDVWMKVPTVTYTYREDYHPGGEVQVGLIADDLHDLGLTRWVGYDEETGEVEDVDYARLSVPLLSIAQQQQKQIDTLRSEVAALREILDKVGG